MSTKTVHVCTGCGSTTFDPARQLQFFESYGYYTCCPERQMVATAALPEKIAGQIDFQRIPDGAPKQLKVDHPWCWVWQGRLNRNGYGRLRWLGKEPVAHRLIWTLLRGPLQRRELLDHLCRRRACCNPNHQEPVSNRENTLRGEAVLFKRKDDYVTAR